MSAKMTADEAIEVLQGNVRTSRYAPAMKRFRLAFAVMEEVEARARVRPLTPTIAAMHDVLTAAKWRVCEEAEDHGEE